MEKTIELVYLRVLGKSEAEAPPSAYYEPFTQRFVDTYKKYRALKQVKLNVVCCGGVRDLATERLFKGLNPVYHQYFGTGWDFGAFKSVAAALECSMCFWMSTPTYFWKAGWLERIVEAIDKYGIGLYGPMTSNERKQHVRTGCAAWSPTHMLEYPYQILSHNDCAIAEMNFADYIESKGVPVKMVTWDEILDRPDWRRPPNIFRRGDQSNCMVWDRHCDIYAAANAENKKLLEAYANG